MSETPRQLSDQGDRGDLMDVLAHWGERAEELLALALAEHRDGQDAIPTAVEALAALYRAQGESPESVRLDAASLELAEPGRECLCTPEQLARGGFSGRCPVHSTAGGQ